MRRLLGIALLSALAAATPGAAEGEKIKAPTRLYSQPRAVSLIQLAGDLANVRYVYGSLDRAARLQSRLELTLRSFERWTGARLKLDLYVLSRLEWEESRYDLAYGLPLRVGRLSLAAPALGDDGTVALWSDVLHGALPRVAGMPLRGTPEQAATLALADVVVQILLSEILVDELHLGGDQHWVRGLVTHVACRDFYRRHDPGRLGDLEAMYALLSRDRAPRAMSARDYGPELGLRDWLWFQAQFHAGAGVILEKTGKGALKKIRKLAKKGGGLTGERLLREWKPLDEWFHQSFAAVSLRTGG